MNVFPSTYRLQFGYWLGVALIAFGVSRSLIEFGRPQRYLASGWAQELVVLCAKNKDVCKSVQISDQHTLWANRIVVEVIPVAGRDAQAYVLMDGGLSENQRRLATVVLIEDRPRVPVAAAKR
jgi:hypothetical protein